MLNLPRYPSLYQINTRVWLTELAQTLGRRATLDDIPDAELDRLAARGFDWIWLLGVWQTGAAAQAVSRSNPEWRAEFQGTLSDLQEDDIGGSCFAVTGYAVHGNLGGNAAMKRLRKRLAKRNLRLMLDFVPNHMAPDHLWSEQHPEFLVGGTEEDLARAPHNFYQVQTQAGPRILAYGRDPYFPGWPDTVQLNYGNPALQEAMIAELLSVAGLCDGVRCDMAMLILPDVFERTWGVQTAPFWPTATDRVRQSHAEFTFMAEVYWDLEGALQQQGFAYTYDKRLYDRLREGHARPVREHLWADLGFQNKLARFLENHDEPRAAATFAPGKHEAAAVITFLAPGLRFLHQGQFEGRKQRISPHLVRAPQEPIDTHLQAFYDQLLDVLRLPVVRNGNWQLLECVSAWDGNWTADCFIAYAWNGEDGQRLLVVVNYADHQSQSYVRLPFHDLAGRTIRLQDLMGPASYDRDGNDLMERGLYVDMAAYGYHVFELSVVE
jgi:glycosidase